ncbi:HAD family hydrolase [Aureivirga sp. CE67]|uniref:HAD family hydrolase n=1 Tax=Aureivirga sp. CE67 TaxID=1788983 RepID=UPI0018CBA489|nr:HAD family hydrolase [Aureivirga sp. CE67]
MKKKLLILDIDETLVHANENPENEDWHFELQKYKVYKRPFLDEFLEAIQNHFEIAVWSSASDDYVEEIVKLIFPENYPLKFVWGRSRCTINRNLYGFDLLDNYIDYSNHYNYVKVLKKVKKYFGFALEEMLIVDDTPSKSKYNYGNAIYPKEFTGNTEDNELKYLSKYLITLKDVENVRTIEKRNWREIMNESI